MVRLFYAYASPAVPALAVRALWKMFSPARRHLSSTHRAFLAGAEQLSWPAHASVPSGSPVHLRGYRWGTGEKTVLLVHGWGGNAVDFKSLVSLLTTAGNTVVALDLPAHGRSGGQQTNLLDMREALRACLPQLGWPHAIVAHSLGGIAVAMLLADTAHGVEKFVFVASPLRGQSAFEVGFGQVRAPQSIRRRFYRRFANWLGRPLDDFAFAPRPLLKAKRLLAIYDTADELVPHEEVRTYLAAYPDIERFLVQDVGHYRLFRHEPVLERVLQFLHQ